MRKFAKSLRKTRIAQNMSRAQLSEKSGVTVSSISAIENAQTPGSVSKRARLAAALGVSFGELWGADAEREFLTYAETLWMGSVAGEKTTTKNTSP